MAGVCFMADKADGSVILEQQNSKDETLSKTSKHGGDNSAGEQGEEGEEDRKRDGKTTSKNGQNWGLGIPSGQRKTRKGFVITSSVLPRRRIYFKSSHKNCAALWGCLTFDIVMQEL